MTVVWFKRDLRIDDHRALVEAAERGAVLPLYIVEPELMREPDFDRSHWEFIRTSLEELRLRLAEAGAGLVVMVGDAVEVLRRLRAAHPFDRVYAHEETGNLWTYARDMRVHEWAKASGVEFREWSQNGVVRRLRTRDGWAERWTRFMSVPCFDAPKRLKAHDVPMLPIPQWEDLDVPAQAKPGSRQPGGEQKGWRTLESWLAGRGDEYPRRMSSPLTAFDACSRLSPHLAYGTLSPRRVYHVVRDAPEFPDGSRRAFLSRLRWRDHFMQKLEDQPDIETRNLIRAMDGMREPEFRQEVFDAWREGMTGYPMMDACLRCAAQTGYLNFRMRSAITAFASYHLWLHWREPSLISARWWLDYEPGIHYSQFQMQSGTTGINALRIYNPVKQGVDHDPDGEFIRRWVPELRDVRAPFIHEPWLAGDLPDGYPRPIVLHEAAAREAKARIAQFRHTLEAQEQADEIQRKHGSRRSVRRIPRPKPPKPDIQVSLDLEETPS